MRGALHPDMQQHEAKAQDMSAAGADDALAAYRQIFSNSSDAIAILDPRGVYLEVNEAHGRLLGHGIDELRGRTPAAHVGQDLFQRIQAVLEKEGVYRGEVIGRTRDEQLKPIDLSCFTVRNAAGAAVCHVWIQRDLSESKRAAESLARSEERYRALIDAAPDVIYGISTKDGTAGLARELSRYVSLAADRADLHEQEQAARVAAERAATRIARLQRITSALSEALTPEQVVRVVFDHGLVAVGARAGTVVLTSEDGATLRVIGASGHPAEILEKWKAFPIGTQVPIAEAVRTGRPVFVASPAEAAAKFPGMTRSTVAGMTYNAWAAVPLVLEGRVIGAMGLSFASEGEVSEEDRAFMMALARQCAQALERARSYEAERAARAEAEAAQQRLEFLAEASNVLAASLDFQTTLATVAQLVVPQLADWCTVDVLTEDGGTRRLATAHVDAEKVEWANELYKRYPPDMGGKRGLPLVLRTGRSEFYPEVSAAMLAATARDAQHLALLEQLGLRSVMIVPLSARGRTLGAVTLVTAESDRHYTFHDLAFAEDLARRVGIAVDNARLYRESRDAVRSKDQAVALLDTLLASAPVGMAFFDRELRFVRINDAMAAINELPVEAHLGRTLAEVRPALEAAVGPHVRRVLETGRPVLNVEIGGRSGAGAQQDFLCSYYPVRSPDGGLLGAGAVVADITNRKRAEEELKQAKESAEAASAAKDHFLAMLSHELRTPLTPVLTAATMLGDEPSLSPEVRAWIEMIRRNVELEARLIDDLLDLTRIERGKLELHFETVDAHELLRQAVEICGESIRDKRLEVSMEPGARRHVVRADAARLRQVLWNLINNAVKFTPAGGRLRFGSCDEADGAVRVDVTDSGIGIDPEMMPRLFQAFEQGERAITRRFGGLGLGLTISKALIDAHGGRIGVESAGKDKGATFSVTLWTIDAAATPAPAAAAAATPHAPRVPDARQARPRKVLLVEDHADTSKILSRLLSSVGHEVKTAASVAEAIEAAGRERFDLVISDIGLPDGSGLDLMRRLGESYPVQGIALSGFGMDTDLERSREAGFAEHLTKPINFQQLASVIERLSAEGR